MKQLVVAGIAVVASLIGGSSFAAAPSSAVARADVTVSTWSAHGVTADHAFLAQALAFDREAPLEAPSFAAKKKKPDILNDKCSFNGSRHLFRLRRTECRMV